MTEEELYAGAGEVTRKCLDDILESEYGFVQDDEETYTSEYLLTYPCKTYAEGLTDTLLQHGSFRTGRRCQRKDCLCPGNAVSREG